MQWPAHFPYLRIPLPERFAMRTLSLLLQNAAEIPVSCFCLLLTTKSAPLSGADGMVHMDVQRQLRQLRAGPLHRTIVPPAMLMEGHSTV